MGKKLDNWSFWVNLIAIIVLVASFFSGMKEGAVKSFFSLVGLIISIPLAGLSYHLLTGVLTFLPKPWDGFIGFLATMGIISIIPINIAINISTR